MDLLHFTLHASKLTFSCMECWLADVYRLVIPEYAAVKSAVQLLQIQEVHVVAHFSACNFLSIFLTCSI